VERPSEFVHVWGPPRDWQSSAEALLYEARWLDLNAKEEGHPERATHFARYADAFTSLIPGRRLGWENGELVVEVIGADVRHGLGALSSGEKQVLLLLADLLLHWTPGSVVLIDEPELHLHRSLQIRFFEALKHWRAERGGQLWLATQSTELFGVADDGTKVLLGGGSL
jgi:predicted ATPase